MQETHFWTLCSNYYCGGLKLEVAANADAKYIVRSVRISTIEAGVKRNVSNVIFHYFSHTQNIFRGINVTQLFVHLDFIEQGIQNNYR